MLQQGIWSTAAQRICHADQSEGRVPVAGHAERTGVPPRMLGGTAQIGEAHGTWASLKSKQSPIPDDPRESVLP